MNDIIFQSFPRKGMLELKSIANQSTFWGMINLLFSLVMKGFQKAVKT